MVEATVNYLARMSERPYFYLYEPPPEVAWRNTKGDRRRLPIYDVRGVDPAPSLDTEGFALVRHKTSVANLYDDALVRAGYYPEMERLVREVTGAARVLAFDHNVRNAAMAEQGARGIQKPILYAHNDYTAGSGPQRVRDLIPDDAERLLAHRFAVINVWKPIRGPVRSNPLAVCDARTIGPDDFMATDLRYPDRTGEIYSLTFNPDHRWAYVSNMAATEALLLKCFDSERHRARYTAHTSFEDPTSPDDAPVRESIEVRTLAFFARA